MGIFINNNLSKLYGDKPLDEQYLTISMFSDGNLKIEIPSGLNTTCVKSISYKIAGTKDWITLTNENDTKISKSISLKAGQSVFLKGDAKQYGYNTDPYPGGNYFRVQINASGYHKLSGNIMSLLYGDDFKGKTTLPELIGGVESYNNGAFSNLFGTYENKVVDASELILPATTLTANCYKDMFTNCNVLEMAPELPATTLAHSCYGGMFNSCWLLTKAPSVLPATILPSSCYQAMFCNCYSLIEPPTIDWTTVTKIESHAMASMFMNSYNIKIYNEIGNDNTEYDGGACYQMYAIDQPQSGLYTNNIKVNGKTFNSASFKCMFMSREKYFESIDIHMTNGNLTSYSDAFEEFVQEEIRRHSSQLKSSYAGTFTDAKLSAITPRLWTYVNA